MRRPQVLPRNPQITPAVRVCDAALLEQPAAGGCLQRVDADNSLARKTLGDWTDTALVEGLRHTAAWAREHGPLDPTTSLSIEHDGADKPEWFTWASGRVVTS